MRKHEEWLSEFQDSTRLVKELWNSVNATSVLPAKISKYDLQLAETMNRYIFLWAKKVQHDQPWKMSRTPYMTFKTVSSPRFGLRLERIWAKGRPVGRLLV
jgi:hypothetical protein